MIAEKTDNNMLNQSASEFDAVRLSLASPKQILDWSHGEVTKPETINYRTQKPEKDGLFCEKIFGPTKDWECYCGKYKRIRYKDVVCDKCGVRVTRSIVRRERMGHISLAVPVTHIWFLRGTPSTVGLALNMSIRDLERVVYFANYIVTDVNDERRKGALSDLEADYKSRRDEVVKGHEQKAAEADADVKAIAEAQSRELSDLEVTYDAAKTELEGLAPLTLLTEAKYRDLNLKYGDVFKADIGAEAIRNLLAEIDLDKLVDDLTKEADEAVGQKKKKILKRLKMLEGMRNAGLRPEWTVMTEMPVIPPDLRPMVQLAGGRFAASDLNDLYRRVINRNNRLKRLIELDAPEVIRRNEKRMLQEAVDALMDNNARRERAVSSTSTRRKLKSLSDVLKGKQGRFRQNLLGKRVDYSGRSVIVSGPNLKLYECGLPKMMALELFKPFVMAKLIERDLAHNVKSAGRMIERARTEVWDTLEEIIAEKYVLLNRAPTLHRLGIQAFKPILIEGKAIQLHPLVCSAFNADFDGDQMAVHVPLSDAAQKEAREIMLSSHNLLKPADGSAVVNPSQDIVLGCYYLTYDKFGDDQPVKHFADASEAIYAYENETIKLQNRVTVPINGERTQTTVGRILLNEILPEEIDFRNETMTKKKLQNLVAEVFTVSGPEVTAVIVDKIKDLGFRHSTKSGVSIGIDDFVTPHKKEGYVNDGEKQVIEISKQYEMGLITEDERYRRTIEAWQGTNENIKGDLQDEMAVSDSTIGMFVESGARGDFSQVNQISGMLGLVNNPTGRIIELPIRSSYKEGFSMLEYFSSTHGARKGLTDTALRTAESGYLTRRLVDVAQDIIVTIEDCGDKHGSLVTRAESEAMGEGFAARLAGRFVAAAVKDGSSTLVKAGGLITDELAEQIAETKSIDEVRLRSVLECTSQWGVCQKCYGVDLARGQVVKLGEPVGVIAAQSIGEPGTQLTMRTFHKGAAATGADITHGLPRVEEIFEARAPKGQAVLSEVDGVASVKEAGGKTTIRVTPANVKITEYALEERIPEVKNGDSVVPGDILAADGKGKKAIKAKAEGTVEVKKDKILLTHAGEAHRDHVVPSYQQVEVSNGDLVTRGQRLTEGSINLQDMLNLLGEQAVRRYIVSEVQSIYASQGQTIADKHIEIIIRQMFSRVQIEEPGDSLFVTGDIVSRTAANEENAELVANGKKPSTYEQLLLPITKISISSDSFLSAASFQDTSRVLIGAAVRGKVDKLRGLKENVIIGRLIPVGTGYNVDGEADEAAELEHPVVVGAVETEPTPAATEPVTD
ncbi:DNA-directed RNA polymerase subunit beta' [Patescibacteria group bacterium]|nr:MAG: DNA-directed RNA polymerase subunit beta' [Patescibacteria group bacterium]